MNDPMKVVRDALADMLNGWKYIRESHGDLYGVGWDRAQGKAEAALAVIDSMAKAGPVAHSREIATEMGAYTLLNRTDLHPVVRHQIDHWAERLAEYAAPVQSQPAPDWQPINVIFDGPPGPESGRFVEVETDDGCSINAGEWVSRGSGLWSLRITNLPEKPNG